MRELDFSNRLGDTITMLSFKNTNMMKLLGGLFLVLIFSNASADDINCDDLIGIWSNERQDLTLSSQRRTVAVLDTDGSISIKFIYDNGEEIVIKEEFGNWACEGSTLSIAITTIDNRPTYNYSQYKLLELSKTYQKMSGVNSNCSRSVGDCGDHIIYEYFKVIN